MGNTKCDKHTNSYLETENIGIEFSKKFSKGTIITLNGDLGAGKTTFVKGVLKGLNYADEVTSPTYTLINEYNADFKPAGPEPIIVTFSIILFC